MRITKLAALATAMLFASVSFAGTPAQSTLRDQIATRIVQEGPALTTPAQYQDFVKSLAASVPVQNLTADCDSLVEEAQILSSAVLQSINVYEDNGKEYVVYGNFKIPVVLLQGVLAGELATMNGLTIALRNGHAQCSKALYDTLASTLTVTTTTLAILDGSLFTNK